MKQQRVKWFIVLCVMPVVLASCSLYAALRKKEFAFADGQALRIKVPKRFSKTNTFTDSAGNRHQEYVYANKAVYYLIHTTDTLALFQPIDTANNIAKLFPHGGVMYKGIDSAGSFWRELRTDSFRFGYRFVPPDAEPLFDSAVNYAGARRFKK